MTALVVLFALVTASGLQALIPGWSEMGYAKLPLLLAVTIYYALTRRFGTAMLVALLAGFLQDAQSLAPLGVTAIPFAMVAYTINRFREEIFILHPITHALCGSVSAGAADMVMALLLAMMIEGGHLGASVVIARCIGSVLLGAVTVPLVYKGIWKLDIALGNLNRKGLPWQ